MPRCFHLDCGIFPFDSSSDFAYTCFLDFLWSTSLKFKFLLCLTLSEKALVERAVELRTELENAASDVLSLFAKIGWYHLFWKLISLIYSFPTC